MIKNANKHQVNLGASITFDNVSTDIQPFDDSAKIVDANTITRNGGLQNNNLTEEAYTVVGNYFYTDNGDKLCIDTSGIVYNNDKPIGTVSPYGVESEVKISAVSDTVVTATGYVTAVLTGTIITITNYDENGVELASRSVDFTGIASISSFIGSLSIIRSSTIAYTDSLEFVIRLGDQISFLQESNPTETIYRYAQSLTVLGSGASVYSITVFNGIIYFAGGGGRVGSFDGYNWRNYDGSGTGTGGYSDGAVIGNNPIYASIIYNNTIVFAGATGKLGSYDGTTWKNYDGTGGGVGVFNNSTVIGAVDIKALGVWNTWLVAGGASGRIGAWNSQDSTWYLYSGSALFNNQYFPPTSNGTAISTQEVTAITTLNNTSEGVSVPLLLVAGGTGYMASYDGGWCTYTGSVDTMAGNFASILQTTPVVTGTAFSNRNTKLKYLNNKWWLIGGSAPNYYVASSSDGRSWVTTVLTNLSGLPLNIFYYDYPLMQSRYIVVSATSSGTDALAQSFDGVTWTTISMPTIPNVITSACISPEGLFIVTNSFAANSIFKTVDMINWSNVTIPAGVGASWVDIHFGVNSYHILAGAGTAANALWVSNNLTNPASPGWGMVVPSAAPGTSWNSVYYNKARSTWFLTAVGTTTTNTIFRENITFDPLTLPTLKAGSSSKNLISDGPPGQEILVYTSLGSSSTACCYTSVDNGTTWVARTLPAVSGGNGICPAYGLGGWLITDTLKILGTKKINLVNASSNTSSLISTGAAAALAKTPDGNKAWIGSTVGKIGSLSSAGSLNNLGILSTPFKNDFSIPTTLPQQINSKIASNGNILLGCLSNSSILSYSLNNGVTWSNITLPGADSVTSVAFGNGIWMAAKGAKVYICSDSSPGGTWTEAATLPTTLGNSARIAFGAPGGISTFLITTGLTTSAQALIQTTDNGASWNYRPLATTPASRLTEIIYGGGNFLAMSDSGSLTTNTLLYYTNTSTLATSLQPITTPLPASPLTDLTYNKKDSNPIWVIGTAVTGGNAILYNTSGTINGTWNAAAVPADSSGAFRQLDSLNGLIVAWSTTQTTDTTKSLFYSVDGINWVGKKGPSRNSFIVGSSIKMTLLTNGRLFFNGYSNFLGSSGMVAAQVKRSICYQDLYNSTTNFSNNALFTKINTMVVLPNDVLTILGDAGSVSSFDGTNWRYPDGSGTGVGPYMPNTLGDTNYLSAAVSGNLLYIGSYSSSIAQGAVNTMALYSYTMSTQNSSTGAGSNNDNTVYAFRYEANPETGDIYYLWHVINAANNKIWMSNGFPGSNAAGSLTGRYAWPETYNGLTRHIITETPRGDSSSLYVTSFVGFYLFNNPGPSGTTAFSITNVYDSTLALNVSSIQNGAIGWNYGDVSYKTADSAVNIYNYLTPFNTPNNTQKTYSITQGNISNIISAYGKLTNTQASAYGQYNPIEIRTNWITVEGTPISSAQSFLSVAVNDQPLTDNLGVLLSGVGEFDDTYTPMVYWNNSSSNAVVKLLYKYQNNFYIIKLSKSPKNIIQRVNENLYKINTISPLNLFDNISGALVVSSADYHGQVRWINSSAPATTAIPFSTMYNNKYSNSVDVGSKLVNITNMGVGNALPLGIRLPYSTLNTFGIEAYTNEAYIGTYSSTGQTFISQEPVQSVYVPTTIIPYPIGKDIKTGGLVNDGNIALVLNKDYDGYTIGNELPNKFQASFILFGSTYIYDGLSIFITSIQNNIVTGYEKVCDAFGLTYIATTPEQVWFLSAFDNSLYTFNGGRTVQKSMTFINMDTINNGVYNSKENTLLLDSTNHYITIRDNQVTQIAKLATQTATKLFSTKNGVIITNNLKSWQYTLLPTQTSTPVPFSWQSGYYGLKLNEKCILSECVITIFDVTKKNVSLDVTVYSYDEAAAYTDKVTFNVKATDYNNFGIAKIRVQPKRQKSLGISFGITSNSTLFITEVEMAYTDAEESGVRNSR